MNQILNKSRGQIAVLYAGILVTLVGALALGVDVSVMYVNWQHAQKVADAAAIAGANYLNGGITYSDPATGKAYTTSTGCTGEGTTSSSQDVATQVACTYAVNNGLVPANITITSTASTIKVVANPGALDYFFAKVLPTGSHGGVANPSLSTYSVEAAATAQASGPPTTITSGMFPAGIQCTSPCTGLSNLVPGQSISFGVKHVLTLSPSNYQWVGAGKSAQTLSDGIQNGVNGTFTVGDTIVVSSGAKTGPVDSAITARLASCPALSPDPCSGGNPDNIPAGDPCLVTVPAVDFTKSPTTIEGFAEVYLENTSTRTQLNACFVQAVAGNTISSSGGSPSLGPTSPPLLTQ